MFQEGAAYAVTGTIRPLASAVVAPLTGRACVAFVAHARVWSRLDLAGVLVDDAYAHGLAPFVLESAEGDLVIDSASFAIDLPARGVYGYPPVRQHAFLRARRLERYLRSTFCDEVIVNAGDRVSVRGVIARERDPDASEHGYRDTPVRLHLAGYPDRPLRIGRPV